MSLVVKEPESASAAPIQEVTRRPSENFSAPKKRGGGKVLVRLITLVVVLGAGLGAIVAIAKMGDSAERVIVTSPVVKSDLVITVTEDGTLESAANVEMKCEVEGGSTILEIIPDGTMVTKGTRLALLDSSTIEENFNAQKNVVGKAEATKIASGNTFDAAKIAVQEYLEGTYVQSLQTAESNIVIAQQNLAAAENIAKHSEKMLRKGYTTPLQHQSNVYSVQKAKLDLELQKTTKMVLEKFTKAKTLEDLESARDSAEAQYKSDLGTYELEAAKLKRLENNLKKCEIIAPQDGMVVYANDLSGGGRGGQQTPKIEQGAAIKQYQAVIRLPDLTKMQVKTLVHESKIEQLRSGQRARIKVQGREVQGSLTQVGSQPEASNFFGGGAKEYAAFVRVDGTADGLKPGMTADVTVLIGEHKGVLTVPVQCVVAKGRKAFAWVKNGPSIEERELVLGATNDTLIEIKDGLSEGDLVLQHPRADVPGARTDTSSDEKVDVEKAFGASKANVNEASAPGGPGGGPGMQGGPGNGPPGEGGPGGGRRGGGGGGGRRRMPSFKEMDKDSDGKVSKEEFPQEMIRIWDFVDTNQDGFFDQEESKAAEERRKQMEQQGGFGGGGGGFGGPGGPPQ
jgi:HlyD family secretion protein